jgi:hypothetical protein
MPETPASRRPKPASEPELSSWDAIAEDAWPGGPKAPKPPAQAPREQGKDTGSHPIYVWNPGAATENLPAIKPGENNKQ